MKPPVLPATRTADGSLLIWCVYCQHQHSHGGCDGTCTERRRTRLIFQGEPCLCPPGTLNGERTAHCWVASSPYRRSGYYLEEASKDR